MNNAKETYTNVEPRTRFGNQLLNFAAFLDRSRETGFYIGERPILHKDVWIALGAAAVTGAVALWFYDNPDWMLSNTAKHDPRGYLSSAISKRNPSIIEFAKDLIAGLPEGTVYGDRGWGGSLGDNRLPMVLGTEQRHQLLDELLRTESIQATKRAMSNVLTLAGIGIGALRPLIDQKGREGVALSTWLLPKAAEGVRRLAASF